MLTRIRIQRFRSCADIDISLSSKIVALIGPNGAGKTNLLKAINWAAGMAVSQANNLDFALIRKSPHIELDFYYAGWEFSYSVEVRAEVVLTPPPKIIDSLRFKGPGDDEWQLLFSREANEVHFPFKGGVTESVESVLIPLMHALVTEKDGKYHDAALYAWFFLRGVKYYPFLLSPEDDVFDSDALKAWKTKLNQPESFLKRLVDLAQDKERVEVFDEIKAILGPASLNVIETFQVQEISLALKVENQLANALSRTDSEEDRRLYAPVFAPPGSDPERPYLFSDLSFGTQRIMTLIVAVLADKSQAMLIEQPEDGLHPGLLRKLMAVLESYADDKQIFLTTHSPAVVDMLSPEDIFFVCMEDGETMVRSLTSEEIDQARNYTREEGALSDFVRALEA